MSLIRSHVPPPPIIQVTNSKFLHNLLSIYIYSLIQAFRINTNHSHLKVFKILETSLENFIFSNQHNNGFSFTYYQKGLICSKSSIFKSSGCTKGPSCSLCWIENEAVCDPCIILEPTFIPRAVE